MILIIVQSLCPHILEGERVHFLGHYLGWRDFFMENGGENVHNENILIALSF